jgi:hypothetical protein
LKLALYFWKYALIIKICNKAKWYSEEKWNEIHTCSCTHTRVCVNTYTPHLLQKVLVIWELPKIFLISWIRTSSIFLLLQIKEANEHLEEDEEDTIADSAFQSHITGKNSCFNISLTLRHFIHATFFQTWCIPRDHVWCVPLCLSLVTFCLRCWMLTNIKRGLNSTYKEDVGICKGL